MTSNRKLILLKDALDQIVDEGRRFRDARDGKGNSESIQAALAEGAKSNFFIYRAGVASATGTPASVLTNLATDKTALVRACVARNANTPREVVLTLSEDENPEVAEAAEEQLLLLNSTDNNE